jgi:hypothetical protein
MRSVAQATPIPYRLSLARPARPPNLPCYAALPQVISHRLMDRSSGWLSSTPDLRAAQQTGVKHYFIEDEAVAARQIPKSLRFLENIKW